ncbi:amino acid/polyamine transporter I [Phaeosphaeriaceae sp. PMI808]|nr:amino acid/polyamine transporter I [Phaeosphaeriaceae sp. PMI808]
MFELRPPKVYSFLSIISLAVSLMATWEALLSTMGAGLVSGGPVSLVWGFVVSFIGNIFTALSLAEAAAIYPSAGGQYQFVAELSPPSIRAGISWYCGWLTVLGWHSFTASAPFGAANLTLGLIQLNHPTFVSKPWHNSVIYWGITLIALAFNLWGNRILPYIQNAILIFHVCFFFAVFIAVLALDPEKNTAAFVFTESRNSTGWSSDGIAWCLGMLTSCYVMIGYDSATHLSEEIPNPSVNIPRAMLTSIILNGAMGFSILLVILFCMGGLDAALASGPFPIIGIFNLVTRGNAAAATALTCTIIISASLATFGLLTTTSRILWAFARDGGTPFATQLGSLSHKSQVPAVSIFVSTAVVVLLGALNIASTTAFAAILSLTVVGLNLSYLMPIMLLFYRRLFTPALFNTGPFKLGMFGAVVNFLSISFLIFTSIFLLFPTAQPVTPKNMNYASTVLGGVLILITGDYFFRARKTYTGPTLVLQGVAAIEK